MSIYYAKIRFQVRKGGGYVEAWKKSNDEESLVEASRYFQAIIFGYYIASGYSARVQQIYADVPPEGSVVTPEPELRNLLKGHLIHE